MNNWFDKEVERLEDALANGEITWAEFDQEMRHLRNELRAAAEDAARQAYKDTLGEW